MTVRDLADTQLKDLHVKCVARDASSTQKRLTAGFVHKEERIVKNAVSRRLGAGLAALAGLGSATPAQAQPQENCLNVEYAITPWSETEHSGGFVASITLTNVCDDPVPDWTLALTLAPGHSLSSGWSADWTATGDNVIATAQSWNQVIAPGSSIIIGFVGVWTGSYQDPSGCVINAAPCDGTTPPVNEEPPTVTLTYPTSTLSYVDGCPLLFTAEASDPDGIDRVEFYVNGVLVGTADTAPYRLEVSRAALPSRAPPFYQYTAFARAYDAGTPPASSDSEPTTFSLAIGDPAPGIIMACGGGPRQVVAGTSQQIRFLVSTPTDEPVTFTVTGDPGITVSPTVADPARIIDVTVTADSSSAGATATLTATSGDLRPETVTINVIPAA